MVWSLCFVLIIAWSFYYFCLDWFLGWKGFEVF